MANKKTGKYDPVKLEIYKNLFSSVAEEMGVTLGRTAFSPNIKERRDYSCAVFDAKGMMVAQALHIPVHLGSMPLSVQYAMEHVQMGDGDVVLLNDPYNGGTHLPDITAISPVVPAGGKGVPPRAAFYVANRAHHADVGGMVPGSMPLSTEIFQEGIRIPPVKIYNGGKLDQGLMDLLLCNVRTPDERRGDLEAQLAANSVGAGRLLEILAKYGREEVVYYMGQLLSYAERMMRAAIREIPDGSYSFEDYMDDDGIEGRPVKIKATITVRGGEATVDFTGSDPQVRGSVNACYAITLSVVFYVFRCLARIDIPSNSGCMAPIKVIAPTGSIVNAEFPSAVAGGNVETSQRIADVLFGALAKALPERIPAASSGTMNNVAIGGYDPIKKGSFTYYETIGGGMGARPDRDGIDAIHTHMTNTMNTPIEAIEHAYPFRVTAYSIRKGSGGKGKFRGGCGMRREYELLCDAQVAILSERRTHSPYGLRGGEAGKRGVNKLVRGKTEKPLPSKVNFYARRGDRLIILTPGGGGFGEPTRGD